MITPTPEERCYAKLKEMGFFEHSNSPIRVTREELDRQLDLSRPCKVFPTINDDAICVSAPVTTGSNPNFYTDSERYLVEFEDHSTIPAYEANMDFVQDYLYKAMADRFVEAFPEIEIDVLPTLHNLQCYWLQYKDGGYDMQISFTIPKKRIPAWIGTIGAPA
jgi:hypothetical protein